MRRACACGVLAGFSWCGTPPDRWYKGTGVSTQRLFYPTNMGKYWGQGCVVYAGCTNCFVIMLRESGVTLYSLSRQPQVLAFYGED